MSLILIVLVVLLVGGFYYYPRQGYKAPSYAPFSLGGLSGHHPASVLARRYPRLTTRGGLQSVGAAVGREASLAVFDFIEGWYNPHRRLSALRHASPLRTATLATRATRC